MNALLWMQLWCIAFALFVSITSFSNRHTYPANVRDWTNGNAMIWKIMSLLTIVAGSIALFESYRNAYGGSYGGASEAGMAGP